MLVISRRGKAWRKTQSVKLLDKVSAFQEWQFCSISVHSADADKVGWKIPIPRGTSGAGIVCLLVGPNAVALCANSQAMCVWGEGHMHGLH